MATCGPASATTPSVSIIIGVYNDWKPLDRCLRSLTEQRFPPSFEVIVVDDGSEEPAPQSIRDWADHKHLTLSINPMPESPLPGIEVLRFRRAPLFCSLMPTPNFNPIASLP